LLVAGLILAVIGIVWLMLPASEAKLFSQAEKYLASEKWVDWNQARDVYLAEIVERFPNGQHADWAQEKISWVNAREAERRMERDERLGRKDGWSQPQIQYSEAREYERFGDQVTALEKFRAIQNLFANQEDARPIVFLAGEGIQRIKESGEENSLQALLTKKMEQAQQAYDRAQIANAKLTWEAIVELYSGNQQVSPIVEQAKARLEELSAKKK
jgi:outer membrane protein assembly factor BamD (BamD/ComL family)